MSPLTTAAKTHLTSLEKRWSSSIHLNMLSTPLRKCIVTSKVLPTSLLVQLKAITLPPISPGLSSSIQAQNKSRIVMLPDQILHPKYAPKKVGKGIWFTLDPSIYSQLEKRGSYRILNPKANVVRGMEGLIWRQLGERVLQELELILERFQGRKRVDLIHPKKEKEEEEEGENVSFSIRMEMEGEREEARLGAVPSFVPKFADETQKERFEAGVKRLATLSGAGELKEVYRVKQSSLTAPLGVALYRLHLWTRTKPTTTQSETFKP